MSNKGYKLGQWVQIQRKAFKSGTLKQLRLKALKTLGLSFAIVYRNFLSYEECKGLVNNKDIQTAVEYTFFYQHGGRQKGCPSRPNIVYKDSGWVDWFVFLGKDRILFEDFKKEVRKMGIKTCTEYLTMYKEGALPNTFPRCPERVFKDDGWTGWSELLNNEQKIKKENILLLLQNSIIVTHKELNGLYPNTDCKQRYQNVQRHIQSLRKEGHNIESIRGNGYRLVRE